MLPCLVNCFNNSETLRGIGVAGVANDGFLPVVRPAVAREPLHRPPAPPFSSTPLLIVQQGGEGMGVAGVANDGLLPVARFAVARAAPTPPPPPLLLHPPATLAAAGGRVGGGGCGARRVPARRAPCGRPSSSYTTPPPAPHFLLHPPAACAAVGGGYGGGGCE
ncbi:unnamed protein product [Closterium sp. NIES-53]